MIVASLVRLWRSLWSHRIPVRLQLGRVECGAACLAMVLSFYGRATTVAEVRRSCRSGRSGVSARDIARAAADFGMTVRGVRPDPAMIGCLTLPAVAHWENDHFVVVERWRRRSVDLVDPAWGRRRIPHEEFRSNIGDALLLIRPGPTFDRAGPRQPSAMKVLARRVFAIPGIRSVIGQILLATLLLQVLTLAMPLATKVIVDQVFGFGAPDQLIALIGIGFGITIVAQLVVNGLRALLLIYLQGRLDWSLLLSFATRVYRLPLRYFHDRTSGDLALRLGSLGQMRNLIANQTIASALDATLVVSYSVVMFFVDPLLASVVLGILVLQLGPVTLIRGRTRDLVARNVTAQLEVQDYVLQTLSGVGTIKASGAEPHVVSGLCRRIADWSASGLRRGQLTAGLDAYETMLRNLTPLAVLWLGAFRVLDGELGAGTLLAFMWLSASVLTPASTLSLNWQTIQMAGVSVERIADVMGAETEQVGTRHATRADEGVPQLELDRVQFRYDEHGSAALTGISTSIHPGQRVAIVGPSGAGKTTLAMVLLGLYRPDSGEVRYLGAPLAEYDLPALRSTFGAVLQEPFVMRGSVAENIAFAHPDATDSDIRWAAKIAEVHDEVSRLPLGYRTPLGENGVGLSGGQLQRLALARAVVGRPSLLVLDEATSHLDAETELRIVANLRGVSCTQIVIAHRLSTIADADRIIVVSSGRIVETGGHHELVAAGGAYARLVAAQTPEAASAQA